MAIGSWVEFIASASWRGRACGRDCVEQLERARWTRGVEIEIGTGAAAAEVAGAARPGLRGRRSRNRYPRVQMFPVPVLVGAGGTRVVAAGRRMATAAVVGAAAAVLRRISVSDHATDGAAGGTPTGGVGVSVTPNASAWAWSRVGRRCGGGRAPEIAVTGSRRRIRSSQRRRRMGTRHGGAGGRSRDRAIRAAAAAIAVAGGLADLPAGGAASDRGRARGSRSGCASRARRRRRIRHRGCISRARRCSRSGSDGGAGAWARGV